MVSTCISLEGMAMDLDSFSSRLGLRWIKRDTCLSLIVGVTEFTFTDATLNIG